MTSVTVPTVTARIQAIGKQMVIDTSFDHTSEDKELLQQQLQELQAECNKLTVENETFEIYIRKQTQERGIDISEELKKGYGRGKRRLLPNSITIEQKLDISNLVHDDMQREIELAKRNGEKLIDTLQTVLEESEIRINELRKAAYEFKRNIVVGAENQRTGKIIAEKLVRYIEDKIKGKDAIIEKLRLKNIGLRNQILKLESQVNSKEELGDVLHYIDFHQLQIENKQYAAKIEEKNEELLQLKMATGKTVQAANDLKMQLHAHVTQGEWLRRELRQQQMDKEKLEHKILEVERETKKQKKLHLQLQRQTTGDVVMPSIGDYILQKRDTYQLESAAATWRKKLEILEMSIRQSTKRRRRVNQEMKMRAQSS